MRADPLEILALEVEAAELGVEIEARRLDLLTGMVPVDARRALFGHEVTARTNFAAINTEFEEAVELHLQRLRADQQRFTAMLLADLREQADTMAMADRLVSIAGPAAVTPVAGWEDFVESAKTYHRDVMRTTTEASIVRVRAEAVAQGVPVPEVVPRISDADAGLMDISATRLASDPAESITRHLRDRAYSQPILSWTPEQLLADLESHAGTMSEGSARGMAKAAATRAQGTGRQAGLSTLPRPTRIYASELLDSATCGPCSMVDGKEYESVEASLVDYPAGRYAHCLGGERCRGTRVFVWSTESTPTLEVPGDRPQPGAGGPGGPPPKGTPFQRARRIEARGADGRDLPLSRITQDLAPGETARVIGGQIHDTTQTAGVARRSGQRMLYAEDGAAEAANLTTEELLDRLDEFGKTIPAELADTVETIAASARRYARESQMGGRIVATSNGTEIVYWDTKGIGEAFTRGTFDHELGHSIRHTVNRRLAQLGVPDVDEDLLAFGSEPGKRWTKAATKDAATAKRGQKAYEELVSQAFQASILGKEDSIVVMERLYRKLPATKQRLLRARLGFTETGKGPGDYPIESSGVGVWGSSRRSAVTSYGGKNAAEDWAESYRLFLRDRRDGGLGINRYGERVRFGDLFPERARVLRELADLLQVAW